MKEKVATVEMSSDEISKSVKDEAANRQSVLEEEIISNLARREESKLEALREKLREIGGEKGVKIFDEELAHL